VSQVSKRRSPNEIALELLTLFEDKVEVNKWDLIKILGNDAQFKNWIEDFFLPERVLEEIRDGRNYSYTLTDRGRLLHRLLKNGNMIKIFNKISGRRLR